MSRKNESKKPSPAKKTKTMSAPPMSGRFSRKEGAAPRTRPATKKRG